ncbi:hypothetical protein FFLO_00750 [Filobasidium floriforme]|uniref:Uncharacterized protein n=1 Tax=Filobasidium floriforme TaxID=5210 RepID=A0A8K0NT02_9TREE|nr:uncharacterized protein HD553DRAFT_349762 [Filobasidium floriforme]KAG7571238.1 hypothetical protein FFLO_00750 [Filobasidium floriforme]KAH8085887.1 hypothetical protein HD553DRAFT_349762 [Filobasidium floriforme]
MTDSVGAVEGTGSGDGSGDITSTDSSSPIMTTASAQPPVTPTSIRSIAPTTAGIGSTALSGATSSTDTPFNSGLKVISSVSIGIMGVFAVFIGLVGLF